MAAGDQCRALVDEAVVDLARLFVVGVGGLQKLAGKVRRKLTDGIGG